MKQKIKSIIIFGACMAGLPGCGRIVDWAKDTFDQGQDREQYTVDVEPYIQSVTLYDQFTTSGKFDVLWLSDSVRTSYVNFHAARLGKQQEYKKAFLRRQLEENTHFISFYLLSRYEIPLVDSDTQWALFLKIEDTSFVPIELKTVDLSPEYRLFFGKRFNRFKVAYFVKFNAKDIDDMPLITEDTTAMEFYFRSPTKEAALTWPLATLKRGV